MQAPGRRRGKGKPRCRPVVEAPAAGEVSFVEQALQRSDYEAKARQLLEAFQQVRFVCVGVCDQVSACVGFATACTGGARALLHRGSRFWGVTCLNKKPKMPDRRPKCTYTTAAQPGES